MTTTYEPNAFDAAVDWALDNGMKVRCPSWCNSDHQQAILEGCHPRTAYEHHGAESGEILLDLRRPFGERELIRQGGDGWRCWLGRVQGPNGWVGRDRAYLEITKHDSDGGTDARLMLELTSGELRDISAALAKMADQMD